MRTSDFKFDLPDELIAQHPAENRTDSRLLHLDRASNQLQHLKFSDLPDLLKSGDLLVFNDTRVIPARLFGHKSTGGKVEILIERIVDEQHALAHVRASKSPKEGTSITIDNTAYELTVTGRKENLFQLNSAAEASFAEILEEVGHMPLPPYISRDDDDIDFERYQTVYSSKPGAVAAPTAGLHFDEATLARLEQKGVSSAFVTLHVGAGTFQPVKVENIKDHHMHTETIEVSQEVVDKCLETRRNGGRIIAVGTTSVRSLETASLNGELEAFRGETDIFIYPGYEFKSVDALITNFHLSESTLLMLVSAFAGREAVLAAYKEAVEQKYRFFSYGDAMFIA